MSRKLLFGEVCRKQEPKEGLLSLPPPELSFEDISPIWASRLEVEKLPTFMSFTWLLWYSELKHISKCVVGEAYGYSSEYTDNCDECDKIGCKFLYYFILYWHRKLKENKQKFVKHWNENHRELQK